MKPRIRSIAKGLDITFTKIKPIVDYARTFSCPNKCVRMLSTVPNKGAAFLIKAIESAISNGKNLGDNPNFIREISVGRAGKLRKKRDIKARGKTGIIAVTGTNLRVVLEEKKK